MKNSRGKRIGRAAAAFLAALFLSGLLPGAGAVPAQAAAKLKYTKIYLQAGTNEKLTISGTSKVK